MRGYERNIRNIRSAYHWRINVHPAIVHLLISSRRLTVIEVANVANNDSSN